MLGVAISTIAKFKIHQHVSVGTYVISPFVYFPAPYVFHVCVSSKSIAVRFACKRRCLEVFNKGRDLHNTAIKVRFTNINIAFNVISEMILRLNMVRWAGALPVLNLPWVNANIWQNEVSI